MNPTKEKMLVAVIDILGFSNLLLQDVDKAYADYESIVSMVNQATKIELLRGWVPNDSDSDFHRIAIETIFSDSIFLFLNIEGLCDKMYPLIEELRNNDEKMKQGLPTEKIVTEESMLLIGVSMFLMSLKNIMQTSIRKQIPLRGACAFGEMVVNREKGFFIGKPVLDAVMLEQAQDWLGFSIHPSCSSVPLFSHMLSRNGDPWLRKYSPPLKRKYKVEISFALNWITGKTGAIDNSLINSLHLMRDNCDEKCETELLKYDNTLSFVNNVNSIIG